MRFNRVVSRFHKHRSTEEDKEGNSADIAKLTRNYSLVNRPFVKVSQAAAATLNTQVFKTPYFIKPNKKPCDIKGLLVANEPQMDNKWVS